MEIFKVKLDADAVMPTKAHASDAGYDLYSRDDIEIKARSCAAFDTGVHIEIPDGYVGFLKAKSGLNVRNSITSTGVIDAGYTGSIVVKLYNNSDKDYTVSKGNKISQIVFLPIPEVILVEGDFSNDTERGDKGFGSSGK